MWHLWCIIRHTKLFSWYLSLGRLVCYFTAGNSDRHYIVYIKELLKTRPHHIAHLVHKPASREASVMFLEYIRNHPEVPIFLRRPSAGHTFLTIFPERNPGRPVDWLVRKLLFLDKIFIYATAFFHFLS